MISEMKKTCINTLMKSKNTNRNLDKIRRIV
jgi:hypothetical protein